LVLLALPVLWWLSMEPDSTPTKHVLVIGLDGVRADALTMASTPHLDALAATGTIGHHAHAGGKLGTSTEQPTKSGPGWTSMLTGVWVDKHGVRSNAFRKSRIDQFPHFFQRIREVSPSARLSSFSSWQRIHPYILRSTHADTVFSPTEGSVVERDAEVTDAIVFHLAQQTPTVVFVQLSNGDHAGHAFGFSPESVGYTHAIEVLDEYVGRMVSALQARPSYVEEDWLVLVTADHGGVNGMHGGQSLGERTIPFIASGGYLAPGKKVSHGPGITAVPPTVMHHLGLAIDPQWGWDSEPFALH
jgi:predicted AlkP superfamily pyrophosphatase or phosphodiesterase